MCSSLSYIESNMNSYIQTAPFLLNQYGTRIEILDESSKTNQNFSMSMKIMMNISQDCIQHTDSNLKAKVQIIPTQRV